MGKLWGRGQFFLVVFFCLFCCFCFCFVFVFVYHEQLLVLRIFSPTVCFLKMRNSCWCIPQKGTKSWHQRHYGRMSLLQLLIYYILEKNCASNIEYVENSQQWKSMQKLNVKDQFQRVKILPCGMQTIETRFWNVKRECERTWKFHHS